MEISLDKNNILCEQQKSFNQLVVYIEGGLYEGDYLDHNTKAR